MSILDRIGRIAKAEVNAMSEKTSDPMRAAEQNMHELKRDLARAMASLADVKQLAGRTQSQAKAKSQMAEECERKAIGYLRRMEEGEMDRAEAEQLATDALSDKLQFEMEGKTLKEEAEKHERLAAGLQQSVNDIKDALRRMESEMLTLKARARSAQAAVKVGETLDGMDSSATISNLERMRTKVEEEEALAAAYGEMIDDRSKLNDEIDAALGGDKESQAAKSLDKLKKDMGIGTE